MESQLVAMGLLEPRRASSSGGRAGQGPGREADEEAGVVEDSGEDVGQPDGGLCTAQRGASWVFKGLCVGTVGCTFRIDTGLMLKDGSVSTATSLRPTSQLHPRPCSPAGRQAGYTSCCC